MNGERYYKDVNIEPDENDNYLVDLMKDEMKENCIESYAYLRINKNNNSIHLISNYPSKWLETYLKNKYYELDPVVQKAKSKITPFLWSKEENENNNIFEESGKYAISHGVCFVAHRSETIFSILSICNNNNSSDFFMKLRKKEDKIQMLLLKCFEEDIANEVNSKIKLTLREQEVLRWLGLGKTYNEISLICEISERTVRFHLVNILKKLDANSTRYALTKAALYGLL